MPNSGVTRARDPRRSQYGYRLKLAEEHSNSHRRMSVSLLDQLDRCKDDEARRLLLRTYPRRKAGA